LIIGLTSITAVAAITNAGALIYDVYRRYKIRSVSFVQVPNKNEGGVEEFRTAASEYKVGMESETILIKSDNTVEVKLKTGLSISYARYIKWKA
jgi:hypothetical protein